MPEEIVCNMCGKPLDIFDRESNFTMVVPKIGYGSRHDGQKCKLQICSKCFDQLVSYCEVSPVYYDETGAEETSCES